MTSTRFCTTSKPGLVIATACIFASGFLSLAYEICWIRKASLVFGATTFALSTVLGVFFAGLAIGSYLSGRYFCRTTRPLIAYAVIEAALGAFVIVSPASFTIADRVFGALYPSIFEQFWAICSLRLVLVAGILLPPSILMGATFPLFCRCFVRSVAEVQSCVGRLYGINTLGATIGCATCGFLLLPLIGTDLTLQVGGACNLAIAVIAWATAGCFESIQPSAKVTDKSGQSVSPEARRNHPRHYALLTLFFLTGFVALGNEIVWTRFLSLLLYNSVYTYTLTLTVILLGIVLGSGVAATPLLRTARPALVLGCVQIAISITVLGTLFLPIGVWQYLRHPENLF